MPNRGVHKLDPVVSLLSGGGSYLVGSGAWLVSLGDDSLSDRRQMGVCDAPVLRGGHVHYAIATRAFRSDFFWTFASLSLDGSGRPRRRRSFAASPGLHESGWVCPPDIGGFWRLDFASASADKMVGRAGRPPQPRAPEKATET